MPNISHKNLIIIRTLFS